MRLANRFDECLEMGIKAEQLVSNKKEHFITENDMDIVKKFKKSLPTYLEHIIYGKDDSSTLAQKKGTDFVIFNRIDFDVKVRGYDKYKYKDILLETYSDIHRNKPGWFYTSESDVIVYVWFDPNETYFIDGYILYLDIIRKYIIGKEYYFKTVSAPNYGWTTHNIAVPIWWFPSNCLRRINKETLKLDKIGDLQSFFG